MIIFLYVLREKNRIENILYPSAQITKLVKCMPLILKIIWNIGLLNLTTKVYWSI